MPQNDTEKLEMPSTKILSVLSTSNFLDLQSELCLILSTL